MPALAERAEKLANAFEDWQDSSVKGFLADFDELRRQVVLDVAEHGQIDASSISQIRERVLSRIDQFLPRIQQHLSENQRRAFTRGIKTVDDALASSDIRVAVPFISETLLDQVKTYGADLVTGLTDYARKRIKDEMTLSMLAQKPVNDTIKAIGKSLTSPSVFGTVANRARTIFVTETSRISNYAAFERMKQVKEQVPELVKEWLHSHAGIPRPGHLALDGVQVETDVDFELRAGDGKTYRVFGPHDPVLPVADVVNCRCKTIPAVRRERKGKEEETTKYYTHARQAVEKKLDSVTEKDFREHDAVRQGNVNLTDRITLTDGSTIYAKTVVEKPSEHIRDYVTFGDQNDREVASYEIWKKLKTAQEHLIHPATVQRLGVLYSEGINGGFKHANDIDLDAMSRNRVTTKRMSVGYAWDYLLSNSDRHGRNLLLNERTGEAALIDNGLIFSEEELFRSVFGKFIEDDDNTSIDSAIEALLDDFEANQSEVERIINRRIPPKFRKPIIAEFRQRLVKMRNALNARNIRTPYGLVRRFPKGQDW